MTCGSWIATWIWKMLKGEGFPLPSLRTIATVLATCALAGSALVARPAAQGPVRVMVQTELGDIVLEVDTKSAPNTAANFLKYVDAGHYDGGSFHRTVKMDNQPDSP